MANEISAVVNNIPKTRLDTVTPHLSSRHHEQELLERPSAHQCLVCRSNGIEQPLELRFTEGYRSECRRIDDEPASAHTGSPSRS